MTAKARVLHALQHGPQTTASLCQPDVGGVRFGARLLELRTEGHHIEERRLRAGSSLYTLVTGPAQQTQHGVERSAPYVVANGAGHKNQFEHVYMCRRCRYQVMPTPRCPKGHQCVRGWYGDFTRPVQTETAAAA